MSDLILDIGEKRYAAVGAAPEHVALKDLHVTVRHGEFVCLLGPSGCGKTTLLNIVSGLDRDYDGRVSLPSVAERGEAVIGYVFQTARLLPWRSVAENIELVLKPEQIASGVVEELLAATGLSKFRDAYPQRLSIGMGRRVALARAFAVQPDLLLLDEPFASLDEETAQRLRVLLLEIWRTRPTTVLFVSHNLREAIFVADRILLLSGSPGTLLTDIAVNLPRDARVRPAEIEAYRERLIRENPEVYRGL